MDGDDDEEEEQSAAGEKDVDSATEMLENRIFPGYMPFALYGAIMPPGSDYIFEDSVARSSESVAEGRRGFNINPALYAASIAQQASAATMLHQSNLIDRHINYHNGRIKRAERDVERWRLLLKPDMLLNPDLNNFAIEGFNKANLHLTQVENEYEKYMDSISTASPENWYQRFVYTTLKNFIPPQDEPQAKRARCSTPMSSIYIPAGNDDEEEGIADHVTNTPPNRNT
ncbi:hypothetical protein IV203_028544 [Nitzschia inconspicua]|uniref:Uncharacterized protein n=1 Tax=Nitzschia inconspicua TaxID=303405 RepID=A0A9K3LQ30_9STRA|nr:hypothetical protein IV203_028544 [Nitzschia inconspicua]